MTQELDKEIEHRITDLAIVAVKQFRNEATRDETKAATNALRSSIRATQFTAKELADLRWLTRDVDANIYPCVKRFRQ